MEAERLGLKSQPWLHTEFKGQSGLQEILVWSGTTKDSVFVCPTFGHPRSHCVVKSGPVPLLRTSEDV